MSLLVTAIVFVLAGILHFIMPRVYVAIMPQWLPSPLLLVYVSGAFEIAGGVGLLVPAVRTAAAVGLIIVLVAVFPANVEMLRSAQSRGASPLFIAACWLRLPLQAVLIWWVWRVSHPARDLMA